MTYLRSFTVPSWKWLVAALGLAALFPCAGRAEAESDGPWEYQKLNDNDAVITKYNGGGGHVEIPATIGDGLNVVKIGEEAFTNNETITSVKIPYGVTGIGDGAFSKAINLESVDIPATVTRIGKEAFLDCRLTSLVIPESVTEIGPSAFQGNGMLASLEFHMKPLVEIPDSAFRGNASLQSVVIPEGVTRIGENAFCGSLNLKSVTFPGTLKEIGDHAFEKTGISMKRPFRKAWRKSEKAAFAANYIAELELPKSLAVIAESSRCAAESLAVVPGRFHPDGQSSLSCKNWHRRKRSFRGCFCRYAG